MTPKEVKEMAEAAWTQSNPSLALMVCGQIARQDLYLNVPQPPNTDGKVITMKWPDRPCKAGCGEMVRQGESVWWTPGWGVSHLECVDET